MRACIYILLLKVLLTEGAHQNYSYYDCKAGYLAPHEDCNIPHIELPQFYPLKKIEIDEIPDPNCVYKCIESEKCIVAPLTCPVPPICPECETTVCAKGQKACGTTPDENELCPPDEVCIPDHCECKLSSLNINRRHLYKSIDLTRLPKAPDIRAPDGRAPDGRAPVS